MRTGIDDTSGKMLAGWDHCAQSLRLILTTRVGSLVMRRDFGGGLADLQDRNPTPRELMSAFVKCATAIRLWEPGFRLQKIELLRAGPDGVYRLDLSGIFYPRGHLGDYSVSEQKNAGVPGRRVGQGISFIKAEQASP